MRRQHPEDQLQRSVCEYLYLSRAIHNFEFFAVPNGGLRSKVEAKIMKGLGIRAGVADLCILWQGGRCAFIELKIKGNTQSPAQIAFETVCQSLGIHYQVCRSLEDVEQALIQWGVIQCRALA